MNGAIPHALPATTGVVITGTGNYRGFTVRETAGASARVVLYDNASAASGSILEEITLNAGESTGDYYVTPGRLYSAGIYASIVGAVEGTVFT